MKKILIQLDSDKLASAFDAIVAYDAGADVVQSYSNVTPQDLRGLILSAVFTRGIPDLRNIAVWIGGSDVSLGEQLLAEACRTFFGPFKISLMLDSNGCNTTAGTAVARLSRQMQLKGKSALVIGPGPVGMRAAVLLAGEGCQVYLASIPENMFGGRFDPQIALRTLGNAKRAADEFSRNASSGTGGSLHVEEAVDFSQLEKFLDQAEIVVAAGPAGLQLLPFSAWTEKSKLQWLIDFNLTEPLGIEGIKPGDDFTGYKGMRALGALAIGNLKMKVHKACVAQLFERNDLVLDAEGVYRIAKTLI
jgi:methylenetetrahydrofolate/methylenetetrahydromethanopterin dehydrogenase (NADP+)